LVYLVDWYFDDLVVAALGKEEELDVEVEFVGTDLVEELGCDFVVKEFEFVLCVRYVSYIECLDDQVEYCVYELVVRLYLVRY